MDEDEVTIQFPLTLYEMVDKFLQHRDWVVGWCLLCGRPIKSDVDFIPNTATHDCPKGRALEAEFVAMSEKQGLRPLEEVTPGDLEDPACTNTRCCATAAGPNVGIAEQAMGQQKTEREAQVGIFWLVGGRLIIHGVPLADAERWGPYCNAIGHEEYWHQLRRDGKVTSEVEYDDPPRGRVTYDTVLDKFYFHADRCILRRPGLVASIVRRLHLASRQVETGVDEHYRCTRCLAKDGGDAGRRLPWF